MRVQYVQSACVVIEHRGIRVLCDPWLTDGVYYGSWFHFPPLKCQPEDFKDVDYLYISHIHPDHLDPATLRRLPKHIPVVILEFAEKYVYRLLKDVLGFEHVHEVAHTGVFEFAEDFSVRLFAADDCNPEVCGSYFQCHMGGDYKKTLQIDSMAVFRGGDKILLNTNDCPFTLAKKTAEHVKGLYPKIDFQLVGYSGAAAYPQCFDNLDAAAKREESAKHRAFKLNDALGYLKIIQPEAFMPFAGLYVLGGKLTDLNAFTSPPKWETLPEIFPPLLQENGITSKMILLNDLEWYDLETRDASAPFVPPHPDERQRYIDTILSTKKMEYEDDPLPTEPFIDKLRLAQKKMVAHEKFYGEIQNDTHFYIETGEKCYFIPQNSEEEVIEVAQDGIKIPYLVVKLDPRLLKRILDKRAHWNNAEIGAHLTFRRDPNVYNRSIHHFLSYLHC